MSHGVPVTGLLTIDLNALSSNWQLLQRRASACNEAAECAAVVKANAYGLGVEPVVHALWQSGCRTYFVATLNEAIELRGYLGSEAVIAVLGGLSHGIGEEWRQYSIIPVLISTEHIQQWLQYQLDCQQTLPCIIKVDTGMHRLGLSMPQFQQLCEDSQQVSQLRPWLIMSHLACADEPSHPLNQQQQQRFAHVVSLARSRFPNAQFSLANSAGMFLGDDCIYDITRPGIALYGGNPILALPNPMLPVVSLSLPIMQYKSMAIGESVGYGATFVAKRHTRLAIVFGGYADGLFRSLSGSDKAYGYIGQYKVPLLGRVSMDSTIFDVTDVPEGALENAAIEMLGQQQTINDLATAAGTISYEILTSLGQRYQRRYIPLSGEKA